MPCSNSRWYQLAVARGYKFLPYRCSSDAAHSIQDLQPQWSQDPRVLSSSARITNVRHIEYLLSLMGVAFNKVVSINSVGPPTDYDQVGSRSRPAGLEDNGPSISPNACIKEPPKCSRRTTSPSQWEYQSTQPNKQCEMCRTRTSVRAIIMSAALGL